MASDSTVKGTLVFFLVGITELSPGTAEIVDIKKIKSSPSGNHTHGDLPVHSHH